MSVAAKSLRERVIDTFDAYGIMPGELWEDALSHYNPKDGPLSFFLFSKGYVSDANIGKKFITEWNMSFSDLHDEDIDHSVKGSVPLEIVRSWIVLPVNLDIESGALVVAFKDPLDIIGTHFLEDITGRDVKPILVKQERIIDLIDKNYPIVDISGHSEKTSEKTAGPSELSLSQKVFSEDGDNAEAPIIRLIEEIIIEACQKRASDIHIEPFADFVRLRFRIDGVLREIDRFAKDLHSSMITRVKIMANMNIAEKRLPQDGRILFDKNGIAVDLRVSVINTRFGETIVVRILDKTRGLMDLPDLGMSDEQIRLFKSIIDLPYGMVLVTGPTGSGKSTTLYAALSKIDQSVRKVITVEDPVEYHLPGINQVQVRPIVGLTFASALRSILRQSPDVIMVGEIRDKETAEIAVQAALTGHLVLSTLHTNDAPSAITRLVEMGIPSYLAASSVVGVVAQRLVRRLCPACKYRPEPQDSGEEPMWQPKGCIKCDETGYKGRLALFEILKVNSSLQDAIARGDNADELRFLAEREGMKSLRDDGMEKAKAGLTTIAEVIRVIS